MKNKIFLVLLVMILLSSFLFSDEIVDTYMKNARSQYIFKDYERAYTYINFVLRSYKDEETPAKAYLLAEGIYYDYLKTLIKNNDQAKIEDLSRNLKIYSSVLSDRILILNEEYTEKKEEERKKKQEEEEKKKKVEEKREKEEEEKRKILEAEAKDLKKDEREFNKVLKEKELDHNLKLLELKTVLAEERLKENKNSGSNDEFNQTLLTILSAKEKSSNLPMIMGFAFFGVIFLIVIIIVIIFVRHSQLQQQRMFEYSMKNLQQPANILPMPIMNAPGQQPMMIEDRTDEKRTGANNEDVGKFKMLLEKCQSFGIEVDEVKGIKNCSKNVAELVYKISKQMGHEEMDCMTNYAVGLVYDIGFLNIDPKIFQKKNITDKDYEIIKTHPDIGKKMIHFVPENYKEIFIDGITKHHENLDGSGYPNGLKKNDLPFISRVLSIVDGYIAQTSIRGNKKIKDKNSAIKDLLNEPEKYDADILNTLKEVV